MKNETQKDMIRQLTAQLENVKPKYEITRNPLIMNAPGYLQSDNRRIEKSLYYYRTQIVQLPSNYLRKIETPNITTAISWAKEQMNNITENFEVAKKTADKWRESVINAPENVKKFWEILGILKWILVIILLTSILGILLYFCVKYRFIISLGMTAGRAVASLLCCFLKGRRESRSRPGIFAVPSAPAAAESVESINREVYVLRYLPPRNVNSIIGKIHDDENDEKRCLNRE
jgi:hypothetical protein